MSDNKSSTVIERLPEEIKFAIQAVNNPHVQELMKELAQYNLGVCVPHMHDGATVDFAVLPDGMVQVEDDLQVSFAAAPELTDSKYIPVAWRWSGEGATASAACVQTCVVHTLQSGGEEHSKVHTQS